MRAITPDDLKRIDSQEHESGTLRRRMRLAQTAPAPGSDEPPPLSTIVITATPLPAQLTTISITASPPSPPAPNMNPPCLSPQVRANSQLTKDNEAAGPNDPALTNGTVPNKGQGAGSHSGVTVSYGYDLAQHFGSNLAAAGLSSGVIAQLQPFLATMVVNPLKASPAFIVNKGPRGTAAQTALDNNPINPPLSANDVSALFDAAYGSAFAQALSAFNNMTQASGGNFLELPAGAQSVLTDLAFNYGSLGALPQPMQTAIANQDWSTLATLLPQYLGGRGTNDANVLKQAIKKGTLASNGACGASN